VLQAEVLHGGERDGRVERRVRIGQLVERACRVLEVRVAQRVGARVDDRDAVPERRQRQADGALAAADVEDPGAFGQPRQAGA